MASVDEETMAASQVVASSGCCSPVFGLTKSLGMSVVSAIPKLSYWVGTAKQYHTHIGFSVQAAAYAGFIALLRLRLSGSVSAS